MNLPKLASVALGVMLVSTALVGMAVIGVGAAAADESPDDEPNDEVQILDKDIEISDGVLTISDTSVDGPGLGEHHIEDRTYTVDSTLSFDGFDVEYDGTTYNICRVTVEISDVGVQLEDVTVNGGDN